MSNNDALEMDLSGPVSALRDLHAAARLVASALRNVLISADSTDGQVAESTRPTARELFPPVL